ncbi:MAG TPA: hypothetical protein ENG87_01055 [Candidatus Pacearchaeota archaeon]|nr:hypothetical protein BMS3Abin17_00530 [archaeon BMS3Abin17]HDK41939.1 hypothetical protein [Candidatus Pacearchaeota archaeon]HDZ60451.1 hypothetical protein [Candidatus Pacearchaeota archaeon]
MRGKKGFLLAEETLKIIIAVISIAFLVYFLTALYFAKVNDEKKVQAEANLKRMDSLINDLDKIDPQEHQLNEPRGWYLFGFIDKKPNTCVGQSCICICDKVNIDTLLGLIDARQPSECDEDGVCLAVPNLKQFKEIEINQQFISIKEQGGFIEITEMIK